jgi:hypothetical protein
MDKLNKFICYNKKYYIVQATNVLRKYICNEKYTV